MRPLQRGTYYYRVDMKSSFLEYVMQDAKRIYRDNSLLKTIDRYVFSFSYCVRFQMRMIQYLDALYWGLYRSLLKSLGR